MTTIPIILGFGLTASVAYGLADFLAARASKHAGPITSAFSVQLIGALLFTIWYMATVHTMPHLSSAALGYTVVSSSLIAIGVCALYVAFEIGPVSLASPIGAAYPLIAAIISLLFFSATLSLWQVVGIALLVEGIMVTSGLTSHNPHQKRSFTGPKFALMATVAWGIGYPLLNRALSQSNWQAVTLIELLLTVLVTSVVLFLYRKTEHVTVRRIVESVSDRHVIGAGAMQMIAGLAINLGYTHGLSVGTLVLALSSTYPVLTMALSIKYFKEHLEKWMVIGVASTIGGVLLLLT